MKTYLNLTSQFEERLGLRAGFFNTLIAEDDWSFVIKLHALVEACLTHAICSAIGRPELEQIVAHLDTANNRSGKLAFAKQLGLLDKTHRRYVTALSQLRNEIVHNVHATDFSFERHWERLTKEQHFQLCVALSLEEAPERVSEPNEVRLIALVNEFPKLGIGYATAIVLSELFLHAIEGDLSVELKRLGGVVLERIARAHQKVVNAT